MVRIILRCVFSFQVIQTQPTTRHVVVYIKPPNYIILSVLVMIFGYWICGLIALIYALQVGRHSSSYEVGKST